MKHLKTFNESIKDVSGDTDKDKYWYENHGDIIDWAKDLSFEEVEAYLEDEDDAEAFMDSTPKHKGIIMLSVLTLSELKEEIDSIYNIDEED